MAVQHVAGRRSEAQKSGLQRGCDQAQIEVWEKMTKEKVANLMALFGGLVLRMSAGSRGEPRPLGPSGSEWVQRRRRAILSSDASCNANRWWWWEEEEGGRRGGEEGQDGRGGGMGGQRARSPLSWGCQTGGGLLPFSSGLSNARFALEASLSVIDFFFVLRGGEITARSVALPMRDASGSCTPLAWGASTYFGPFLSRFEGFLIALCGTWLAAQLLICFSLPLLCVAACLVNGLAVPS